MYIQLNYILFIQSRWKGHCMPFRTRSPWLYLQCIHHFQIFSMLRAGCRLRKKTSDDATMVPVVALPEYRRNSRPDPLTKLQLISTASHKGKVVLCPAPVGPAPSSSCHPNAPSSSCHPNALVQSKGDRNSRGRGTATVPSIRNC